MARWRDYLEPEDEPVSVADRPEPEPDVPNALGVLFGAQLGWSPAREFEAFGRCATEGQALGRCRTCGNGEPGTPIQPGSRIVCAGCLRYGLDDQVRALLAQAPPKPRNRPCTVTPSTPRNPRKNPVSGPKAGGGRS